MSVNIVVVIVVIVVGVVDRDAVGRVDDDSVVGLCSLRKWLDISSADATRCIDRTSTTAAPRRTRPRGGGSAATRATKRPPTARNGTRTVPAGSRRALSTCCRFVASVTSSSLCRTSARDVRQRDARRRPSDLPTASALQAAAPPTLATTSWATASGSAASCTTALRASTKRVSTACTWRVGRRRATICVRDGVEVRARSGSGSGSERRDTHVGDGDAQLVRTPIALDRDADLVADLER